MTRLSLTLACGEYDRTRALADGSVQPEGIDLEYVALDPGELFERVVRNREFAVAEMSLSTYLNLRARGDDGLVGIPVFPSRVFRHGYIFVNRAAGISRPQDLAGRQVGMDQWQLTSSLWLRGILADDYGVSQSAISWVIGGQDRLGSHERASVDVPPDVRIEQAPADKTLSDLLAEGAIDALFAPHIPRCHRERDPRVGRLFGDHRAVEADYYRRTGLFPIMHLVVVRRDVYEAHRWAAASVFTAFRTAKARAMDRLRFTGTLAAMVPWLVADFEEAEALFGARFWPYGMEANRPELSTAIRYAREQGIARRDLTIEELFAPETHALEDDPAAVIAPWVTAGRAGVAVGASEGPTVGRDADGGLEERR
jgi:4,5-dihydroxyphthalate decarboxylase